jgi:hypothetical protein
MKAEKEKYESSRPLKKRRVILSQAASSTEGGNGNQSDASDDDEFKMATPKFYAIYDDDSGEWSTVHGNYVYNGQAVYPNFTRGPGSALYEFGNDWVAKLTAAAKSLGYKKVYFSVSCDVPSAVPGQHDTFRCHPNYHPYPYLDRPWYDWAICKWHTARGATGENAGRVVLWGTFTNHKHGESNIQYAAVQGLSSMTPRKDRTLSFGTIDRLESTVRPVAASDIRSVAYVLPTVKNGTQTFPTRDQDENWFIVLPPRHDWKNMLWPSGI